MDSDCRREEACHLINSLMRTDGTFGLVGKSVPSSSKLHWGVSCSRIAGMVSKDLRMLVESKNEQRLDGNGSGLGKR